jgi:outer membrane protein TolC
MLLGSLLLGGCVSVGPDYARPDVSVSDQWHTALKGGLKPAAADPGVLAAWWTTLNDEALSGLIERAVAGNLNLKMAKARVRQARASRRVAVADFFPSVDSSASGSRVYSSSDTVADR